MWSFFINRDANSMKNAALFPPKASCRMQRLRQAGLPNANLVLERTPVNILRAKQFNRFN